MMTGKEKIIEYLSDDIWITRFLAALILLGVASYLKGGFTI